MSLHLESGRPSLRYAVCGRADLHVLRDAGDLGLIWCFLSFNRSDREQIRSWPCTDKVCERTELYRAFQFSTSFNSAKPSPLTIGASFTTLSKARLTFRTGSFRLVVKLPSNASRCQPESEGAVS